MVELRRTLLANGLSLIKRLEVYGVDKGNVKEDLTLLFFINDIITNDCYYNYLTEKCYVKLIDAMNRIIARNSELKTCRFHINDIYVNYGGKKQLTIKN